jgi:hypothetical protein
LNVDEVFTLLKKADPSISASTVVVDVGCPEGWKMARTSLAMEVSYEV